MTQYQQWTIHKSALLTFHHLSLMTWPGQWTAQGSMWPLQVHNKSPLTHCRSERGTGELTMNSNHIYWFFPALLWSSLGSFGFTFPDWKLTRAQSDTYYHDWAFLEVTSLNTYFITWGFAVRNLWLSDVVFLWPLNFMLLGNIPLVTLFVCPVPPDNQSSLFLRLWDSSIHHQCSTSKGS